MVRNSPPQIIQEFRHRRHPADQQMVSGTGAGNVEQVPLGVVDLAQIGIVADRLDALLQGDHFVVAGHHHHSAELQALGEMHGPDRDMPAGGSTCSSRTRQARPAAFTAARPGRVARASARTRRSHAAAPRSLARSAIHLPANSASSRSLLSAWTVGGGPLNTETSVAALLAVAVHIGNRLPEQPVGLRTDLVGCAVINS